MGWRPPTKSQAVKYARIALAVLAVMWCLYGIIWSPGGSSRATTHEKAAAANAHEGSAAKAKGAKGSGSHAGGAAARHGPPGGKPGSRSSTPGQVSKGAKGTGKAPAPVVRRCKLTSA